MKYFLEGCFIALVLIISFGLPFAFAGHTSDSTMLTLGTIPDFVINQPVYPESIDLSGFDEGYCIYFDFEGNVISYECPDDPQPVYLESEECPRMDAAEAAIADLQARLDNLDRCFLCLN